LFQKNGEISPPHDPDKFIFAKDESVQQNAEKLHLTDDELSVSFSKVAHHSRNLTLNNDYNLFTPSKLTNRNNTSTKVSEFNMVSRDRRNQVVINNIKNSETKLRQELV